MKNPIFDIRQKIFNATTKKIENLKGFHEKYIIAIYIFHPSQHPAIKKRRKKKPFETLPLRLLNNFLLVNTEERNEEKLLLFSKHVNIAVFFNNKQKCKFNDDVFK